MRGRRTQPNAAKWITILVVITCVLAILAFMIFRMHKTSPAPLNTYFPKASTTPVTSIVPTTTPTIKPLPQSSTPVSSSSGNIVVASPTSGSTVTNGTMVNGTASVVGGKVSFRLKGSNSGQLASGSVQVTGTTFSFPLNLNNQVCNAAKQCGTGAIDTGVLEVFSLSPQDGSEINQASIPVEIKG